MIEGFKILDYQSVRESLRDYHASGARRGEFCGFKGLDEFYTMALPGCTDWSGLPGSGKTEIVIELLINRSLLSGWKHLLYVPDIGSKDEIIANIIHKITGKSFNKLYRNFITEPEIEKELHWVLEHFKILHKVSGSERISPRQFWDLAVEMHKEDPMLKTAVIDSWKDLKHDRSTRDDLYLDDVLSYRNELSEVHGLHFHTIIHPNKTEKKDGKREPPTAYDLKGGTSWYDNGKTMVTIHRVDGTANEVDFMVTKAKPKSVAKKGQHRMYFDIQKSQFYEDREGEQIYAMRSGKFEPQKIDFNQKQEEDYLPF